MQTMAMRQAGRRWFGAGARSYDNYLRGLQNQTIKDGQQRTEATLLLESQKREVETGLAAADAKQELAVEEIKFVSYNQLAALPDRPKDPMMMFRDIDNIRLLAEATGSEVKLNDTDCSTLCMDLLEEVKRGRRLTKDIVAVFEKMELHPNFYQVRGKAYNIMVYNTLAREYPLLETPARLYGNLLEKEGKAPFWMYVGLARVQMFLPPVERRPYQEAFLDEIKVMEGRGALAPYQAQTARRFIRNLQWITDLARWTIYVIGFGLTISFLRWAYHHREDGRVYREHLELENYKYLDEQVCVADDLQGFMFHVCVLLLPPWLRVTQYYGNTTPSKGGRSSPVIPGRAGLHTVDTDD